MFDKDLFSERTLQEARDEYWNGILNNPQETTECPCCNRLGKLWPMRLKNSVVRTLLKLYRLPHDEYHHYRTDVGCTAGSSEFAYFKHWGLATPAPEKVDGKSASGYWAITQLGIDFCENKVTMNQPAWVYDNKVHHFGDELVNVRSALTDDFDYDEFIREAKGLAPL